MKYAAMLAILGLSFLSAVQVSNAQADVSASAAATKTEAQASVSHIDLMLPVSTTRTTHSI